MALLSHARALTAALVLVSGSTASVSLAQVVVTPVATTGDRALSSGSAALSTFGVPVINNAGQVAFTARMTGGGTNFTNDQAVYVRSLRNKLVVAARSGAAVPGLKGSRYGAMGGVLLGDDSHVLFMARMNGGKTAGQTGVLGGKPGAVRMLTRTGAALPGQAGVMIEDLQAVAMNPRGDFALLTAVQGAGVTMNTNRAMIVGSAQKATGALRTGLPMPASSGMPGASFALMSPPVINPEGVVAFSGFLTEGVAGITESTNAGVFSVLGDSVGMAAAEGMGPARAPGTHAITFSNPAINASGGVAHMSMIEGAGVDQTNDIVIEAAGQTAARLGESLADNGLKMGVMGAPLMNAAGDAAFVSTLLGAPVHPGNDQALWVAQADGRRYMVAREGTPAKNGLPATIIALGDFAMSASGHLVFSATVTDAGEQYEALYSWDAARGTVLIAQRGTSLLTAAGVRSVSTIEFAAGSGGEDGRAASLNGQGQVTFRATFGGGAQGVYIATLPGALSDVASTTGLPMSDGQVTSADLQSFMTAYALGEALADVAGTPGTPGGDGVVDENDLIAFTADYERH